MTTPTSLEFKNKKRPLLTASGKSFHLSFYTATLEMMVKEMGTPYNPLFPRHETSRLSAPIAAATVFKDRNFYFSTAKVVIYSARLRHSAKEMKIKNEYPQK